MLPTVGIGASAAAGASTPAMMQVLTQFTACRMPWRDYISALTKEDSQPLHVEMNPKPMYRGRKLGREGSLFREATQLHYRRYPDEGIYKNLNRWLHGDTLNDIQLQQFKNAQPMVLDNHDERGFQRPLPEVYMKINYKNPATLGRFLTRTGHFYPADVLPLNPQAVAMLHAGVRQARRLGLFPKYGNPFWHRSQKDRPKPYQGEYDPVRAGVKETMEQYCFNWLQSYRIKQHFLGQERKASGGDSATGGRQRLGVEQGGYEDKRHTPLSQYAPTDVPLSEKNVTVAGLMSTSGLRKNYNLYSRTSNRRCGFGYPISKRWL